MLYACAPKNAEEAFINDLLSRMTLEEKIGQLNQLDPSYDTEAKEALIRIPYPWDKGRPGIRTWWRKPRR